MHPHPALWMYLTLVVHTCFTPSVGDSLCLGLASPHATVPVPCLHVPSMLCLIYTGSGHTSAVHACHPLLVASPLVTSCPSHTPLALHCHAAMPSSYCCPFIACTSPVPCRATPHRLVTSIHISFAPLPTVQTAADIHQYEFTLVTETDQPSQLASQDSSSTITRRLGLEFTDATHPISFIWRLA